MPITMDEELAIIKKAQDKIQSDNTKKNVAILNQVLEPIQEAMGELTDVIKESVELSKKEIPSVDYFDKDFNKNIVESVNKLFGLLQKFKQPDISIDLSPITSIASEIKRGNDSLIDLVKQSNSGNKSDELFRLITAMVGRQNIFLEKGFQQIDYSQHIDAIAQAINNKKENSQVEEITFTYDEGGRIKKATPTYKK